MGVGVVERQDIYLKFSFNPVDNGKSLKSSFFIIALLRYNSQIAHSFKVYS